MEPDMLELMEVYYGEKAAEEYKRMQSEVTSLIAELAESQRRIAELERRIGEAWTPVPDGEYHPGGGNRVLAYPLVVSHNEVDNRMTRIMCGPHGVLLDDGWRVMRRRTSSGPTAEGE